MIRYTALNEHNYQWFSPIIREEMLSEYLSRPVLNAIGAVCDKTACGILIYEFDGHSFQIRYLAVSDAFRRKGIATGLVDTLCRYAAGNDYMVFVEFFADVVKEKDGLYRFFDSLPGCQLEQAGGCIFRADRKALEASEIMKHAGKKPVQAHPVAELTSGKRHALLEAIGADEQITGCTSEEALQELSLFSGTPDKPETAVFFTAKGEETVRCNYVWCAKGKEVLLVPLLAHVCDLMLRRTPEVRALEIAAVTEESEHLTKRLIKGASLTSLYYEGTFA